MTENDREIVETLLDVSPVDAFNHGMLDVFPDDEFLDTAISKAHMAYDDFTSALYAAEARAKEMAESERKLRKALGLDDD